MVNGTLKQWASEYLYDFLVEYVDIDYSLWLSWLLMPLLVTFLLPAVIILLFYISAIIFHIYRLYRQQLVGAEVGADWWHRSRKVVAAVWDAHGWLWHGYEISGLENIPETSPVLFIFYHGALPVDMYYFMSKVYLYRNRLIHTVADRLLFKIPGWAIVLEGLHVIPGTVQQCVGVLREGNMLAISPGGVYEAQFGSEHYELLWKQRRGFAKVALEAKVPIVPLFTRNVREAFRTVGLLRRIFLRIYAWTRVPLAPVYGGFPVKLVTHVGKPIPYVPGLTPDQLNDKVAAAVEELIEEHQRIPGSITRALIERIYCVPKPKKKVIKETVTEEDSQNNVKQEVKGKCEEISKKEQGEDSSNDAIDNKVLVNDAATLPSENNEEDKTIDNVKKENDLESLQIKDEVGNMLTDHKVNGDLFAEDCIKRLKRKGDDVDICTDKLSNDTGLRRVKEETQEFLNDLVHSSVKQKES